MNKYKVTLTFTDNVEAKDEDGAIKRLLNQRIDYIKEIPNIESKVELIPPKQRVPYSPLPNRKNLLR